MRGRTRKVRGSKPFAEGLAEANERVRKSFRGSRSQDSAEKPSRKQPRKAEAKKTTSATRGRASRKG